MLVNTTTRPTSIYMVLIGILPTNFAAKGPAITPPKINPSTSKIGRCFNKTKKVTALANTTKNSAKQTDPTTYLGDFLFDIKVLVTKAPHPPPANASIKPPIAANQPARFTLESNCLLLKAFRMI